MGCGASKSPRASEPVSISLKPPPQATAPTLMPLSQNKSPEASVHVTNSMFSENYRVMEQSGHGPGFICKKCVHIASGMTFSVKFLKKKLLTDTYMNHTIMRRELLTLKSLTHQNLVKILEFYDDENNYIIVQEHCAGGQLLERVSKKEHFSEEMVKVIMHQLLSVVRYCHERKVLHRDLSPETVLLEEASGSPVIKVTDFGSLSFFDVNKRLSGRFGTVYYCAPEIFDGVFGPQCDLWSCGVLMHILLAGFPPFQGVTDTEVRKSICEDLISLHEQHYNGISDSAKDLLHRLLIKDPFYRIDGEEALQHKWFHSDERPHDAVRIQNVVTSMGRFRNICKLKDAIFSFICTHMLSVQDYKELRAIFESIDQNGDGTLSRTEIQEHLATCLPAATINSKLEEIFAKVDTDRSGKVDYQEFIKATIDVAKIESKDVLRRTFQMFDKDSNGFISCEELKQILENSNLDEGVDWNELLREADTNGDGVIDMMEFESLIQKKV